MDIASIVVSASELYQWAKEILNSGMDLVEVSIIDDPADPPASIFFDAWKASAPDVILRFEVIDDDYELFEDDE